MNEIGLVVGIKCTHDVQFRGLALEIKKKVYDFYLVRGNWGEFKATYVILVRRDILGVQQSISY